MATALTHAFVGIAAGLACMRRPMPARFWVLAAGCSAAPDLDVLLHGLGVAYEDPWGHRGMTHAPVFALGVGLVVTTLCFWRAAPIGRRRWWGLVTFFTLVTASHGLIDAFTNGGLGIAFLAPFDDARFFMPWAPLEVPGLSVRSLFTMRGLEVIRSELQWVWLPVIAVTGAWLVARPWVRPGRSGSEPAP